MLLSRWKKNLRDLRVQARVLKSQITKASKKIADIPDPSQVEIEYSIKTLSRLRDRYDLVFQDVACLSISAGDGPPSEEDDSVLDGLTEQHTDYLFELNERIESLKSKLSMPAEVNQTQKTSVPIFNFKLPKISIPEFSDNDGDPCKFFHFKSSLNNALESVPNIPESQKLMYLKTLLRGKAFSLVDSLPIDEGTYNMAMELLDAEFLDTDLIIHQIFDEVKFYPQVGSLGKVEEFLTFLRFKLVELEKFDLDFSEGTSGAMLLSSIVRDKLPRFFKTELSRRTGFPYPQLEDILKHAPDLYKILHDNDKRHESSKPSKVSSPPQVSGPKTNLKKGFKPNDNGSRTCKFCSDSGHVSSLCSKYGNHSARVERAKTLSLCTRCLSSKHDHDKCPGKQGKLPFLCASCKVSTHARPMCPNGPSSSKAF